MRKPEITRERILKAAMECFENYGYKKTTLDEIASIAGVGKGTVYLHFKDKDELFIEVIKRKVSEQQEAAAVGVIEEPDTLSKLTRMAQNVIQYLNDNPLLAGAVSNNPKPEIAHLKPHFERYREIVLSMTEDVLIQGVESGDLKPVNTRLVAFVLYNAYASYYLTSHLEILPATSDEYIALIQQLLREGIVRK